MFETLQDRLSGIFDKLTRRGALSEDDVNAAMREVRRALIEADVALEVVRSFIDKVRERAIGKEVIRSVTPGQMVIKIVHDTLVETLGAEPEPIDLQTVPPVVVMMVGLQGSGKTTTTAKVARRFTQEDKKKVLMASLDTRRPAAQEQLKILGEQAGVDTLPIVAGEDPVRIARRALDAARLGGYDVVMLDTAGRLHVDEELMRESVQVRDVAQPHETLLVADALTGQDAVNVAKSFNERVGVTGIVLTRVDGDGRGGAALSMRAVTGKPIKLLGTGEKLDGLETFHPDRVANRILGKGDVVSLVEKAAASIDADKAQAIADRMKKGSFDLEDLAEQLKQMERIGGMSGVLGMLPGIGKMKKQIEAANVDNTVMKRQLAIINSMTRKERRQPKLLNASRKRRVAAGSGTEVQDINKLLKMHRQMADMMKKLGKNKGLMGGMFGGGAPDMAQMADAGGMPEIGPDGLPKGLPPDALPKGLSGLGGPGGPGAKGLPGLGGGQFPGLPKFPGKKK